MGIKVAPTEGGKDMKARGTVDARALLSQTYFEAPHSIRHDKFCDRLAAIGEEAGWLCTREADRLVWCGVGAQVGERVAQTAAALDRRGGVKRTMLIL